MDKKILIIMGALVVVALLVVAGVLAASGGIRSAGGFTTMFDKMTSNGASGDYIELALPSSWHVGDKKTVSDRIVDMRYHIDEIGSTSVYTTTLWFVYLGNKWNDPQGGTYFRVPTDNGWLYVANGLFHIQVSSATNLSAKYDIGDVITVETLLVTNGVVALGDWVVAGTL